MPSVIWPVGSRRSRAARAIAIALLLTLSVVSQEMTLFVYPGTNGFHGMVGYHGTAAYSLIEDGTLTGRAGDLGSIKGFVLRSGILTNDYVQLVDLLPALKKTKPGDVLFYYPPGYPLYLAGTFLVSGYRYDLAREIQELLNMFGTPLLLLWTGTLLGSFPTGFAAATIYSLFAGPVQQTFFILPDALMPFMLALVLAISAWCMRRDRLVRYVVLGVVLGLAANLRSDALGVAPFLALGIWQFRRKLDLGTLTRVATVGSISFILLIPYGLIQKNFKPIGRFQITSPGLGQNLWEAYGETPNPHGATLSDADVDQMLMKAGHHIHLPDGEAYLRKVWLRAALRDPGWFLWSVRHRQRVLLGYWQDGARMGFRPLADPDRAPFRALLIRGTQKLFSLLVIGLFVCSIVALFGSAGLWLGAAPLGYFIAFSVLHLDPRYVLPVLAPLTYLGCHGVWLLSRKWRSRLSRASPQPSAPV